MLAANTASARVFLQHVDHVLWSAAAAGRDQRHVHRVGDQLCYFEGRSPLWCRRRPCSSARSRRLPTRRPSARTATLPGRSACGRRGCGPRTRRVWGLRSGVWTSDPPPRLLPQLATTIQTPNPRPQTPTYSGSRPVRRTKSSTGTRLGSMFTTVAHRPNRLAVCATISGSSTAAVLMLTFSAPAWISAVTSSIVRMPPPTVKGMKHCSATRRTMS